MALYNIRGGGAGTVDIQGTDTMNGAMSMKEADGDDRIW